MKIIGVGTDLVEISRIELALSRSGSGFINELLNKDELQVEAERIRSVSFIAGRIAAKEAVAKAIGTGLTGFHWHEIEISNDAAGRPTAQLRGRANQIAKTRGVDTCLISISHTTHYATAQAVAVNNEGKNL